MVDYQKLVDECKKAYANNDLSKAWTLWQEISDILLTLDNEDRNLVWKTYNHYIQQFTDEEVYRITDYGKTQAYGQQSNKVLEDMVSLYDLTKDEKMKSLDYFTEFYEWYVIKNGNNFDLYDYQLNENVEENDTLEQIINRLVCGAIDYYKTEWEIEDEDLIDNDMKNYLKDLYLIAKENNQCEQDWLDDYKDFLKELGVEI